MIKINFNHLLSNLIRDYEKMYGTMGFEVKKINNTFVFTNVDQKVFKLVKVSPDCIVGKTLSDLPINKESKKKLQTIYEKAWNGKEMAYYEVINKDITIVCIINPVLKNGKVDKLEGNGVLLGEIEKLPMNHD